MGATPDAEGGLLGVNSFAFGFSENPFAFGFVADGAEMLSMKLYPCIFPSISAAISFNSLFFFQTFPGRSTNFTEGHQVTFTAFRNPLLELPHWSVTIYLAANLGIGDPCPYVLLVLHFGRDVFAVKIENLMNILVETFEFYTLK